MKATELRIGNYLEINGSFRKLSESLFISRLQSKKGFSDIKPIPLTEQWLVDLGFRKDEETNYRWFMEDWLAYDLDDNCIIITGSWEFGKRKYVHELQNLYFALTGKELKLKTKK